MVNVNLTVNVNFGGQQVLTFTSSNVLLERGSEKPLTVWYGLSTVFPSTALVHLWLFIELLMKVVNDLTKPLRMPFPFLLARETMMQRS